MLRPLLLLLLELQLVRMDLLGLLWHLSHHASGPCSPGLLLLLLLLHLPAHLAAHLLPHHVAQLAWLGIGSRLLRFSLKPQEAILECAYEAMN